MKYQNVVNSNVVMLWYCKVKFQIQRTDANNYEQLKFVLLNQAW